MTFVAPRGLQLAPTLFFRVCATAQSELKQPVRFVEYIV